MSTGLLYLSSLIFLTLVVCSVYTLAIDISSSGRVILRNMGRRFLRLAGVLAALAVVVYFLSLV